MHLAGMGTFGAGDRLTGQACRGADFYADALTCPITDVTHGVEVGVQRQNAAHSMNAVFVWTKRAHKAHKKSKNCRRLSGAN
jgi:hypothetical protein